MTPGNQISLNMQAAAHKAHAEKMAKWRNIAVAVMDPELGRYDLRGTAMDVEVLGEWWRN